MTSPTRPYVVLEKPLGETPLQAIEAWKEAHPSYADIPATYAGRLDPMATGKLLVLLADECKRQQAYRGLDKEYEIEVLLDVATDTGDVLGMPAYAGARTRGLSAKEALAAQIGRHEVPYPAYSSKTVDGKPLFLHALEGTLGSIEIPTHAETVYRIEEIGSAALGKEEFETRVFEILSRAPRSTEPSKGIGSDFRQDAIRGAWETLFDTVPERAFTVLTLRVACASGTYMRTLARRIGSALGTQGMALSICRTRIGRYRPVFGTGFWSSQYR